MMFWQKPNEKLKINPIFPLRKLRRLLKTAVEVLTRTPPTREPLRAPAAKAYEMLLGLPEHRAMTTREILDALGSRHNIYIDESTWTKDVAPELVAYGMKNRRRVGYYIPIEERPKKS